MLQEIRFEKSTYYDRFLFVDEKNVFAKASLRVNFNEWALNNNSYANFYLISCDGELIGSETSNINVIVNGEILTGGIIKLNSKSKTDTLLIELAFDPSIGDKRIKGFVQISDSDLDRINNIQEIKTDDPLLRWRANFEIITNPLKKAIILILIAIAGLLLLWFIFLRNIVYPKIGRGQLTISSPYYKTIKLRGYRMFLLTNKRIKQKLTTKLFVGKKGCEVNELFSPTVELTPVGKGRLRIRMDTSTYQIEPFTSYLLYGNDYNLKKENIEIRLTYR